MVSRISARGCVEEWNVWKLCHHQIPWAKIGAQPGGNGMNGYIQRLKKWSAEQQAVAAAVRAHNARPLEVKIRDWYAALPPAQRREQYAMSELVLLFNAAPGRIGMALHRLGWERRRRFSGPGSYCRYWSPPR
jgi:hypothetical protein